MLEWLWDGLGPAERVAAAALAAAGSVAVSPDSLEKILHENGVRVILPELKNAPDLLEDWDLIQPISGEYKFRVELLRQWIQKYKRISRIRDELNRLEPDADAYYQMAIRLYYEDHAVENALAILQKAIDKNPYHSEANSLQIMILIDLGKFDEANKYIEQMQYFDPKNARLLKINNLLMQARKVNDFVLKS
jgi:tetratricopeptide (TPR) repeat protein